MADIRAFLEPFFHATKATEGKQHSVGRVIPTMDFLLNHYERSSVKYANDPFMKSCVETGWAKLDLYYKRTDQTPIYIAAVVLDPSWKWSYFYEHWTHHPEWIPAAKRKVTKLWNEHYKSTATAPDIQEEPITKKPVENTFCQWYEQRAAPAILIDEYTAYCEEPVVDIKAITTPIEWWQDPIQRRRYPNLSLMALDILSIPAMAADAERLFSAAKLTVTDKRGSLEATTIELIQCLKSWNKSSIFTTTVEVSFSPLL